MSRSCRIVAIVFALLYAAALVLLAIGTFGLFGSERDPLAAVFLIPLGLPWNLMLDGVSDGLRFWIAVAAPALNLILIRLGCRMLHSKRADGAAQHPNGPTRPID